VGLCELSLKLVAFLKFFLIDSANLNIVALQYLNDASNDSFLLADV
jgi:hypothetical protein